MNNKNFHHACHMSFKMTLTYRKPRHISEVVIKGNNIDPLMFIKLAMIRGIKRAELRSKLKLSVLTKRGTLGFKMTTFNHTT